MSIVRALPEIEEWLSKEASAWVLLADDEYKRLVAEWTATYRPLVESRQFIALGRSLEHLNDLLPADALVFNGVRVPEIGNPGGGGPTAYSATHLRRLDVDLLRQRELLLASCDFSWCCLFSHETGSMFHEEFYRSA